MKFVSCSYYTHNRCVKEVSINLDNISHILYEPYNDGYGFKDEKSIMIIMKTQFSFSLTGDSSTKLIRLLSVYNLVAS